MFGKKSCLTLRRCVQTDKVVRSRCISLLVLLSCMYACSRLLLVLYVQPNDTPTYHCPISYLATQSRNPSPHSPSSSTSNSTPWSQLASHPIHPHNHHPQPPTSPFRHPQRPLKSFPNTKCRESLTYRLLLSPTTCDFLSLCGHFRDALYAIKHRDEA